MIRTAKRYWVAIILSALIAARIFYAGCPGTASAGFSLENGVPDNNGYYYITKTAAAVKQAILFDGAADFIFSSGFYLNWESVSGLSADTDYEISFLTAAGEGIVICRRGLYISALFRGAAGKRADILALAATGSAAVNVSFVRRGEEMALSVNGRGAEPLSLEAIAEGGYAAAGLSFENKTAGLLDTVRILGAGPASRPVSPYLSTYDIFKGNDVTVSISGPEEDFRGSVLLSRLEGGKLIAIPAGLFSYAYNGAALELTVSGGVFPQYEGAAGFYTVVCGGAEYCFTVRTGDSVNFEFEDNIEYTTGGADLVIPINSFGLSGLMIKKDNKELIGPQGEISADAVILRAEYLATLSGAVRFNLYGTKKSGLTVEKTLNVYITEGAHPTDPPDETEYPPEEKEPAPDPQGPGWNNETPGVPGENGAEKIPSGSWREGPDISPAAVVFLSSGGVCVTVALGIWIFKGRARPRRP